MEEIPRLGPSRLANIVSSASGIAYGTGIGALGACYPETLPYMFIGAMASLPGAFVGWVVGGPGTNAIISCGVGGAVGGAIGTASVINDVFASAVGGAIGGTIGVVGGVSFEDMCHPLGGIIKNTKRFLGYALLSGALMAGGSLLEKTIHEQTTPVYYKAGNK